MLIALLLTIIIELAVLYFLKERHRLFFVYWGAVTALTNLLANLFILYVFSGSEIEYWICVGIIEILVFISEGVLCFIYNSDLKKSIKYSAVCTLFSFGFGLLISLFI